VRQVLFIPCKPFVHAKTRLAGVLAPRARQDLARALYVRTLDVLARCRAGFEPIVISSDAEVLALARQAGFGTVVEAQACGINPALGSAMTLLGRNKHLRYAYVPIDLPKLCVDDLHDLVAFEHDEVVIAPDLALQGTNFLSWPSTLQLVPAFGAASYVAHSLQVLQQGSRLRMYDAPALRRDLDLPDDLRRDAPALMGIGHQPAN
jgi:2-phospho-L-lactate guanylyltransferase